MNEFILAETEQILTCVDSEQIRELTAQMLYQADRKIDILSYDFDPLTYNNEDIFNAFEHFALQNHRNRVRIILHNPQLAVSRGHRIIELGKRLSSFFNFRCLPERFKSYTETFLIVDDIGVIHRPYPDSLKTNFHFADAQFAKSLNNTFTQIWDEAEPHPYLSSVVM